MYKTLALAVLLLPTFAIAQSSNSATPFPSPLIVAKGKLKNQTAPIPTTTIFTPTLDGLYRLSVYMTQTVATTNTQVAWSFNATWTDDAGDEAAPGMLFSPVDDTPPGSYDNLNGGSPGNTLLLQVKAGTVVTYSTTLTPLTATEGGTYSLYYALERLE
jgi:hypothetical protein